jgi:hypothetical protein
VPVIFTAKGVAELYRGNRRLWRGTPPASLLTAAADVIAAKSGGASGTYSVRLESATVTFAASPSVVINGTLALP